jgi:endonuclease-3
VRQLLTIMKQAVSGSTSIEEIKNTFNDPFSILVSTLISLRTRDAVTLEASLRLLEQAPNAQALAALTEDEIAKLIYPAGFYKNKARQLRIIGERLEDNFSGAVPRTLEELVALPGVGKKTANLTLAEGFGIPAICVDIHVHRIANRLGLIETGTPDDSIAALEAVFPKGLWNEVNPVFVRFGQTICLPRGPKCGECPLQENCEFYKEGK